MTAALKHDHGAASARQQLLDTARRLFAERGFHAVSLRELAQAVGLQAGSLYTHIESKEALLLELIEDGLERLIDSAQLHLTQAGTGRALSTFLHHHLAFQLANPHWYVLALTETRHLTGDAQDALRSLRADYILLLERLLAAHLAGGGDPWRIAKVARQTLYLLNTPPGSDGNALDDCIDDLERLILNRLRP